MDIQQFLWSMENFPGNFFPFATVSKFSKFLAGKRLRLYHFSLPMVLRCAREARESSTKTTTTNKKRFLFTWRERVSVPHESPRDSKLQLSLLFVSVLRNETRSSQSYSATAEQRRSCLGSWDASLFRLPRIPKNVWNGCTGAKVRITFSYIRSEGFNIAVEINYIKMEW